VKELHETSAMKMPQSVLALTEGILNFFHYMIKNVRKVFFIHGFTFSLCSVASTKRRRLVKSAQGTRNYLCRYLFGLIDLIIWALKYLCKLRFTNIDGENL
jgi:hypothetical protein